VPAGPRRRALFPRSPGFLVRRVSAAPAAVLLQLQAITSVRAVFCGHVVPALAHFACQRDRWPFVRSHGSRSPPARCRSPEPGSAPDSEDRPPDYLMILVTRPAPTVRPPSRIANRRPSSIAIGEINLTCITVLSPGITISVPSGNVIDPVTSVVRK